MSLPYRLQSRTDTVTVSCLHADASGQVCGADVQVFATFNPRDQDGPAYYAEVMVQDCPLGCEATPAELRAEEDAAAAAFQERLDGGE